MASNFNEFFLIFWVKRIIGIGNKKENEGKSKIFHLMKMSLGSEIHKNIITTTNTLILKALKCKELSLFLAYLKLRLSTSFA